MKHMHYDEVESRPEESQGAEGVHVRWLISDSDGAPNFYMRRFDVEPGGRTPHHAHPWEHEVYVLEGRGMVVCEARQEPFQPGDFVYVPPDKEHCFIADAESGAAFLCLIPREGKRH